MEYIQTAPVFFFFAANIYNTTSLEYMYIYEILINELCYIILYELYDMINIFIKNIKE